MSGKKPFLCILMAMVLCFAAVCADLTSSEVVDALWVMTDSVGACLASSASASASAGNGIALPGVTVTSSARTGLPERITYNSADMLRITEALRPAEGGIAGYLSRLMSNPRKVTSSPLTLACYYSLLGRGFSASKYILSGTLGFSYEDPEATFGSLLEDATAGRLRGKVAVIHADMRCGGSGFSRSFTLRGDFETGIAENGKFFIRYPDGFHIDDKEYGSGTMSFAFDVTALR